MHKGAAAPSFARPALLPYGKRGFRAAICKIACPQPPLAALLIRSGGAGSQENGVPVEGLLSLAFSGSLSKSLLGAGKSRLIKIRRLMGM